MKTEEFKSWLLRQGAEVLAPTNQYEIVRFRAKGAVHIVYWGRKGLTMGDFAQECYDAFQKGHPMDMGLKGTQRGMAMKYRHALVERDGRGCFYCLGAMPDDDITVEHLVPLHKGGPNHLDNMALAHKVCNGKAANIPLVKKIAMREKAVAARAVAVWLRS